MNRPETIMIYGNFSPLSSNLTSTSQNPPGTSPWSMTRIKYSIQNQHRDFSPTPQCYGLCEGFEIECPCHLPFPNHTKDAGIGRSWTLIMNNDKLGSRSPCPARRRMIWTKRLSIGRSISTFFQPQRSRVLSRQARICYPNRISRLKIQFQAWQDGIL